MESPTSTTSTGRGRGSWCRCCSGSPSRLVNSGDEEDGKVGEKIGDGNLVGVMNGDVEPRPEHLVIMVNGIVGSANDWKFAAERFANRLNRNVAIHCSSCNASKATFDGVDTMGSRLADEVREVIKVTPGLRKISFIGHSLGGLVARYAIAKLYRPGDPGTEQPEGAVGGLDPVNYISVATPHLGSRGNKALPSLAGVQVLEKTAPYMAHWFVGRTGKHLFMTDGNSKANKLPLLRRMVTDCDEGQFLSSLRSFQHRTAYANVIHDHAVGYRTSCIRRPSEVPEIRHVPLDPRYPHIVRDELSSELDTSSPVVPAPDPIEEEILVGLNQLSWRRVDVSFKGAKAAFQAHNIIQVKNAKAHLEGKDVIDHIIDKHFLHDLLEDA